MSKSHNDSDSDPSHNPKSSPGSVKEESHDSSESVPKKSQRQPKGKTGFSVVEDTLEWMIFASRWIQAPLYLGLILGSVLYTYKFMGDLVHLWKEVNRMTEEAVMLVVLNLVDITMVANLITMVVIGGYASFVSRLPVEKHEDRPDWLQKVDAGTLKIKLVGSLVGISGIHLLKTFINIDHKPHDQIPWQIGIHATFLLSALMLAATERILHPPHKGH
jgi:uncharacterized protein (TIGR00645 family)